MSAQGSIPAAGAAITLQALWVASGCSRCGRATAAWGRRLPLAVPMNERLLVAVVHSKAAVSVSARPGLEPNGRFRGTPAREQTGRKPPNATIEPARGNNHRLGSQHLQQQSLIPSHPWILCPVDQVCSQLRRVRCPSGIFSSNTPLAGRVGGGAARGVVGGAGRAVVTARRLPCRAGMRQRLVYLLISRSNVCYVRRLELPPVRRARTAKFHRWGRVRRSVRRRSTSARCAAHAQRTTSFLVRGGPKPNGG